MKCMKCSKNIPDVSTTCPFCDHPVGVYVKDKDKITIPDEDEKLTSVKLSETKNSDNDISLEAYIDEPKKKNHKIGIIAIVVLVVIIIFLSLFIALNMMGGSKSADYHELFTGTIRTFFDHFIENYTGNYATSSGEYTINADINYDSYTMSGTYAFNTKDRILSLTGNLYANDPDEIVVDYQEINYILYSRRDEVYFSSSEIFDRPILFPIKDTTGFLSSKSYDLSAILTGIEESLIKAFDASELKTVDDNINHMGVSRDVSKTSITLDNEAKRVFYRALYQSILDDSNFINEYARLKDISSNDLTKEIQELYDDIDYTYPIGEGDKTIISIYHDGTKLYRIEMIINKDDDNRNIELDISNDKYTIEYYENGKNILSGSLEFGIKETEETIRKEYKITYDDDDAQRTFDVSIIKDKNASMKKQTFKDVINIRDFKEEDYLKVEENLKKYTANISWIRPFGASFANICTPDLDCNCPSNSKTCSCTHNGEIITCAKEDVTKKDDNENDDPTSGNETTNEEEDKEDKPSNDKEDDDVIIID